jgi:hypothetical protein
MQDVTAAASATSHDAVMASEEAQQRLAEVGLLLVETSRSQKRAADTQAACDEARAAWDAGAVVVWPSIDIPYGPLSKSELFALSDAVTFTMGRASDGYRPSRPAALALMSLVLRLVRIRAAAIGEVRADRSDELTLAALDAAYLIVPLTYQMLQYLRSRPLPMADPETDAWANEQQTEAVRRSLLTWLAEAHDDLDDALQTSELRTAEAARAKFGARRVLAIATVVSAENGSASPPGADLLGSMSSDRLADLTTLISAELQSILDDVGANPEYAAFLMNAVGVIEYLWKGDSTSFYSLGVEIARWQLPTHAKVNALVSTIAWTTDEECLDLLQQLFDLVDSEPPVRQQYLCALAGDSVLAALARLSLAHPAKVSALAGRLAGFGADRLRWTRSHPHLWLIPGRPGVAVLDHGTDVEVVPLERLDYSTLAELTHLHAEEYVESHDPGRIRRDLSDQLRPLGHHLADLAGPVSFYSFGHLKHIPLPALTGRDVRLAAQPGLYRLAHRLMNLDKVPRADRHRGRAFVVDDDLEAFKRVPVSKASVFKFDSTDPCADGIPPAFEQLTAGWREVLFFGHGYVDQFRSTQVGLVTRFVEGGAMFSPPQSYASFDLRSTELAVVLGCGSGQGNVFVEPHASVADGFCLGGAQWVIAPTWPILAADGAEFLARLTSRLDRGESAVDAWAAILQEEPNRFCSICLFAD